jgi:arylsulfatase A-like enzyme/Tfp pilus assembly protein PilF
MHTRSIVAAAVAALASVALACGVAAAQTDASSASGAIRAAKQSLAPHNVLLITLDTTRRDYVGFMGRTPSPTPMLDHLAQFSVVFDDAITAVPLTLPSHTTIHTGLYPAAHGVRDNTLYRVPPEAHTLAEILKEHGYATRADVAAFVLDPCFGLDQGFDRYRAPPRTVSRVDAVSKTDLDAKTMVDRAIEDVNELTKAPAETADPKSGGGAKSATSKPFFLWLHLFDPHFPYTPPEPPKLTAKEAADPVLSQKRMYEQEIRCMDRELGRLFALLEEKKLLDDLVIVVCGDHGESLRDAPEGAHGFFLYDPTVRVPLLVHAPGVGPRRVPVPVSLVDVTPTVLALLAVDVAGERFDGLDLGPWMREPSLAPPDRDLMLETLFAWTNFAWAPSFGCTHGPVKYVHSAREELFDRATDPEEKRNLFTPGEPRAAALSRRVDAHLATPSLGHASVGLNETDRARLQALGYAGGGSSTELPQGWASLPDPRDRIPWMEKFNEVMSAVAAQKPDEAVAKLRELIAEEPRSASMREQLGLMLLNMSLERSDEALKELEAAVQIDPRRSRAWYGIGHCHELAAGREHAAAKALRDQRVAKDSPELRQHVQGEVAELDQAEQALRQALACEPDHPESLTLLGKILSERADRALRRGDRTEATALYRELRGLLERTTAVLPRVTSEWAEAATALERVKTRLAELEKS